MDAKFHRRWRKGGAPFDGVTLSMQAPLPTLSRTLTRLVQQLWRVSGEPLYAVLDWHEHDGYITQPTLARWDELEALVRISEPLQQAFAGGDTYVRRAYFPQDRSFYLRLYVHDPAEQLANEEPAGDFDLTCSQSLANVLFPALTQDGENALNVLPAQAFFNRRYGG